MCFALEVRADVVEVIAHLVFANTNVIGEDCGPIHQLVFNGPIARQVVAEVVVEKQEIDLLLDRGQDPLSIAVANVDPAR